MSLYPGPVTRHSVSELDLVDYVKLPGSFTFATLPKMQGNNVGLIAVTTDQGICNWNGTTWIVGTGGGGGLPPVNSVTDAMLSTTSIIYAIDATYMLTAGEISAGVTPTNFGYPPGNVLRYGADPTGVSDSTAAFVSGIKTGANLYCPPGVYKSTPLVFTGISNCRIYGAGYGNTTIELTSAGTLWTFNGGNFNLIENLSFIPVGTLTASSAITLSLGTSNTEIRSCLVQNFTGAGINFLGISGNQLSGNRLMDSYLLTNAIGASVGQLNMSYSNDFFVAFNQFGNSNVSTYPAYGITDAYSSNGNFTNNFVWNNTVGMTAVNASYGRYSTNRFEQSRQQGFIATSCGEMTFVNNWINNNGQAATNTYENCQFNACVNSTVEGNIFYDWSSGVNSQSYSVKLVNNQNITFKSNRMAGYATAPLFIDNATESLQNINFDFSFSGSSSASVAAASTVFLGVNGTQTVEANTEWSCPKKSIVARIFAASNATPTGADTYTYTLMLNNVAQSLTCQITAGNYENASTANPILVIPGSALSIRLVTSATATSANHRIFLDFVEY